MAEPIGVVFYVVVLALCCHFHLLGLFLAEVDIFNFLDLRLNVHLGVPLICGVFVRIIFVTITTEALSETYLVFVHAVPGKFFATLSMIAVITHPFRIVLYILMRALSVHTRFFTFPNFRQFLVNFGNEGALIEVFFGGVA